jgi:hypothetical protein
VAGLDTKLNHEPEVRLVVVTDYNLIEEEVKLVCVTFHRDSAEYESEMYECIVSEKCRK